MIRIPRTGRRSAPRRTDSVPGATIAPTTTCATRGAMFREPRSRRRDHRCRRQQCQGREQRNGRHSLGDSDWPGRACQRLEARLPRPACLVRQARSLSGRDCGRRGRGDHGLWRRTFHWWHGCHGRATDCTPSEASGLTPLIDNMADGDTGIIPQDGRMGGWYTYGDGTGTISLNSSSPG